VSEDRADPASLIDVYADVVPGPGQRRRGQRRTPTPTPERRGFEGPVELLPELRRPTRWAASDADVAAVIGRVDQELLARGWTTRDKERRRARTSAELLLDWLTGFDGDTWQQRWIASGLNDRGRDWTDAVEFDNLTGSARAKRTRLLEAAGALIVLDVIRPSYRWLYGFASRRTLEWTRADRDPDGFARLDAHTDTIPNFGDADRAPLIQQVTRILIHNGGTLDDITVDDCREAYAAQVGYAVQKRTLWYRVLLDAGFLPPDAPPSIFAASRTRQRSVTQLVDGYGIEHAAIRGLLIDYLTERQAELDYSSTAQLASKLALLFWRDLEIHEPGIDSLHLSDEVARRWKERLKVVRHGRRHVGKQREDPNAILIAVRMFYTDLNHWAIEYPARWARWAAPNPISSRDLIGQNKQKRRAKARMQQRTRELAPLLPTLVDAADQQRRHAAALLAAGRAACDGESFTVGDETLVRTVLAADPANGGAGRPGMVWALDPVTGQRRNVGFEEERTFWGWAIIEVLRHTGARIEELTELTHRSLVAYTLPSTGETIPLLQITPSKTDKERLLVVSPELSEVLAAIIDRVRNGNKQIPLIARYDHAERIHSPPLPFLFQRPWGLANAMISPSYAGTLIHRITETASITLNDGTPARITPHGFRRIYATEAVSAGLPVHIAAKVLGHDNLNTTQGYVAIYDTDVIEHHRAFIARRRNQRPSHEYRDVTDDEWDEFLSHFEKRKVELGTCGRAYATPCIHEHACIRCPLLQPDPRQLPRLQEIHANLHDRLTEAHTNGWTGEIEGLKINIAAAEQKLQRLTRDAMTPPSAPARSGDDDMVDHSGTTTL